MKVIHVATTLRDGAGIGTRRQHEALRNHGIDSRVVGADSPDVSGFDYARCPSRPVSLWQRAARRFGFNVERQAIWERRLARLERRTASNHELFSLPFSRHPVERHAWLREADVVNLHWVSGFVDYPSFFHALRKPLVWTLHDQNPYSGGFHYELDRRLNPGLRPLDDACFDLKKNALAQTRLTVVGNSDWNTSAARTSGMFPDATRFETVYYPLDTERYAPLDKPESRAALGIPSGRWVVGFASTSLQNRRKGFADLIAALRLIKDRAAPLVLLSFGRPPDDALRASVPFHWQHLGYLDTDAAKRTAYSAMDCFVIPSHAEAFGQTAIEALACGTSVVGADVGGIREALDQGRCGCLFPPGDIPALAGRLLELGGNPAQRRALAEAGRVHVSGRHAPAVAAQRYVSLYEQLLSDKS